MSSVSSIPKSKSNLMPEIATLYDKQDPLTRLATEVDEAISNTRLVFLQHINQLAEIVQRNSQLGLLVEKRLTSMENRLSEIEKKVELIRQHHMDI